MNLFKTRTFTSYNIVGLFGYFAVMVFSTLNEKDAAYASSRQLATRSIGQTMSLSLLTLVFLWTISNLEISP